MNYQDRNLQAALAGEYVLGTMVGRARARFQKLRKQISGFDEAVIRWENHLAALDQGIEERRPSDQVWRKIESALFKDPGAKNSGLGLGLAFWRYLAIGASAMSLLLGLYIALPLVQQDATKTSKSYVSIFEDDQKEAIWTVKLEPAQNRLLVNSINVPATEVDQDYELWLLRPNDQAPVSLGLLPQTGELELPLGDLSYADATGIAVSLEPKGGSTTGLPTGPVLYVAKLFAMG